MKRSLAACLLALVVSGGCVGPFNAFRTLNNWNAKATDNDVVNELIFLGLWILPVYQIVALSDLVVFNTIDYFGENPLTDPGPFPDDFGKDK